MLARFLTILVVLTLGACDKAAPENDFDNRLKTLEADKAFRDVFDGSDKIAFLPITDQGYVMAEADFGKVAISVENVRNYANGVKVRLKFGNTTAVTASGLSAKIEWGAVDKDGAITGKTYSKKEALTEDLPSASWKEYDVILPSMAADKIGFVRVSEISTTSISLRN